MLSWSNISREVGLAGKDGFGSLLLLLLCAQLVMSVVPQRAVPQEIEGMSYGVEQEQLYYVKKEQIKLDTYSLIQALLLTEENQISFIAANKTIIMKRDDGRAFKQVQEITAGNRFEAFSISADSKFIASITRDSKIYISQKLAQQYSPIQIIDNLTQDNLKSVVMSQSGSLLIVGGAAKIPYPFVLNQDVQKTTYQKLPHNLPATNSTIQAMSLLQIQGHPEMLFVANGGFVYVYQNDIQQSQSKYNFKLINTYYPTGNDPFTSIDSTYHTIDGEVRRYVVLGSQNNLIRTLVWSPTLNNFTELDQTSVQYNILDVSISGNGDYLGIGLMNSVVNISKFSPSLGRYEFKHQIAGTSSPADYARSISFNQKGTRLAIGYDDFTIKFYELQECGAWHYFQNNYCMDNGVKTVIIMSVVVALVTLFAVGVFIYRKKKRVKFQNRQTQPLSNISDQFQNNLLTNTAQFNRQEEV